MEDHQSGPSLGEAGPIKPLKVIVFDCDGVLFDSKDANIRFYSHILEQIGHSPVRPDQHEYIHMHTVSESLRYLLPEDDLFHAAASYCQGIDFRAFNVYLRRQPGLVEVLELAKGSYHTALATNRTVSTHDVLAHFDLAKYFDLVVSASDVSFPKPHPESMQRILKAFGATAEEILYVGDSPVDEALAEATGVYFVAYKNPSLKAHMHVEHFSELVPVLGGDRSRLLSPRENVQLLESSFL
jgi:phosphoglycolate phosphatase